MEERIGYKAMNANMTCRGFKYKIGKTYKIKGDLEICKNAFHFCNNIFNTLRYYSNIKGYKRLMKPSQDIFV